MGRVLCGGCRCELAEDFDRPERRPCSNCGSMARAFEEHLTESVTAKERIEVSVAHGAWQKNWPLVLLVAALTLGSPFLGLVLSGWPGVWVGLALNVTAAVLGIYAVTRLVTITRG